MVYGVFKALIATLSICAICSGAFLHAECPIDTIIVNGHVENASRKGIVKVQLIYPKGRIGESGDVTLEDGRSAARSYRRAGVPESVIMKMCGWETRTMFERYNIVDDKDCAEAVALRETKRLSERPSEIGHDFGHDSPILAKVVTSKKSAKVV